MKRKFINTSILSILVILLFSANALANKTSVKIIAPEKAKTGSEVTIKIEVSHMGNTSSHFTDKVVVKINDKEYKTWKYSKKDLPTSQNFTVEFKVKLDSKLEIVAEGFCNKHGAKGIQKATINIE